jgi:hypothetical protein
MAIRTLPAVEAPAATALDAPAGTEPVAEASFALDRASLDYLIANAPACDVDRIRAAVERADHDDAAIRALARMKLGLPLPPDVVTDVLVGVDHMDVFFALARHASSASVDPLLDLLRSGRFADDAAGADQEIYTAFVLWQAQRPEVVRPVLVPRLRRFVRRPELFVRPAGLAGWLVAQIDDPHLTALFEEHYGDRGGGMLARTVGRFALDVWNAPLDEMIGLLPERVPEQAIAGAPVRAAPKVGRNEPCPCGSGKKFKRCCADRPAAGPAGTDASRAERLRALEPRLEPKQVGLLSRADLARLDLARLREGTVIEVMRRQGQLHDWRRACLAADELARRNGEGSADEYLQDVIYEALHARHHNAARQLVARLGPATSASTFADQVRLELELARPPAALAQLEAAASVALAETGTALEIDLAYAALSTLPALGILIARGALRADSLLDAELLLDAIEEARDELALPPGDPAQELFAALGGVHEQKPEAAASEAERTRLERAAAGVRAGLDDATNRLAVLQQQVADHQRELERAERASAEANQRAARSAAGEEERRSLRSKVDELHARIREGNEERSELRRQLSTATESKSDGEAAPEAPSRGREHDGDDDDGEDLPAGGAARSVQIPQLTAAAAAAFETVPRNIAAVAMRTIGALAAGDPAAWRAVKQAKDMPRQVLMARVGIHHRLLFRAGGVLDVLDLVTRENLMTTLKRLRSG